MRMARSQAFQRASRRRRSVSPRHRYVCRQLSDRQVQQAAAATSSNAPVVTCLLAASWTVAIGAKAIHTPVHDRGEHCLIHC